MADIRINALVTTAATSASDDYLAVDGTTNATRKLSAYSPSFGGNLAAATVTTSGAATLNSVVTSTITGSPTVSGNLTVSGTASSVSSSLSIDGAALSGRFLYLRTGTSPRWSVRANSTAESGALAGSDFAIANYSDAGAYLTDVFTIARATGNTTIIGNLTVSGTGSQRVGGVGSRLILQGGTADTPASAAASGTAGSVVWDASYIYVCTATNTWKRAAIATW